MQVLFSPEEIMKEQQQKAQFVSKAVWNCYQKYKAKEASYLGDEALKLAASDDRLVQLAFFK